MPYWERAVLELELVSEVHLWNFAREASDAAWLHGTLAKQLPYVRVFSPPPGTRRGNFSAFYAHYARTMAPDDVLLKVDDDVVRFSLDTLADFLAYRRARRDDVFLLSANVVNNGVAAYYQHAAGCLLGAAAEPARTFAYPPGGLGGALWASPRAAIALHTAFLADPACILAMRGTQRFRHRLSVNAVALSGAQAPWAHALLQSKDPASGDHGDENTLTTLAGHKYGARNLIFLRFVASHATFFSQSEATAEVLELYRRNATAACAAAEEEEGR